MISLTSENLPLKTIFLTSKLQEKFNNVTGIQVNLNLQRGVFWNFWLYYFLTPREKSLMLKLQTRFETCLSTVGNALSTVGNKMFCCICIWLYPLSKANSSIRFRWVIFHHSEPVTLPGYIWMIENLLSFGSQNSISSEGDEFLDNYEICFSIHYAWVEGVLWIKPMK